MHLQQEQQVKLLEQQQMQTSQSLATYGSLKSASFSEMPLRQSPSNGAGFALPRAPSYQSVNDPDERSFSNSKIGHL